MQVRGRLAVALLMLATPALAQAPFGKAPPGTNPFGGAPKGTPPAEGIAAFLLRLQAEFHLALTKAFGAVEQSNAALLTLLGLAFAYGVIHAIGPGHGKAVIAAYLVSSERAAKRGIALSLGAALVQALVAFALVGVVALLMGGTRQDMERTEFYVGQAGYALIALMGFYLVYRKLRALLGAAPAACAPDCGHDHGPAPENASTGQLVLTAIGAGLRPCTGAIILLVFALTKGLYLAGALAVAVMALGTALGTSLFALLALKAKALSLNLLSAQGKGLTRLVLALELLAGLALAALGIALFTGAMAGGG